MTYGVDAALLSDEQIIFIRNSLQAEVYAENERLCGEVNPFVKEAPKPEKIVEKEPPFDPKNNWFQKALRKGKDETHQDV